MTNPIAGAEIEAELNLKVGYVLKSYNEGSDYALKLTFAEKDYESLADLGLVFDSETPRPFRGNHDCKEETLYAIRKATALLNHALRQSLR